jgi:hypothetical protein
MSDDERVNLRSADKATVKAAAIALGSIKTEKKASTSRANILAAKAAGKIGGRPQKSLSDIPCTCGRGDDMAGHPTTCLRGLAIRRRQKAGTL